MVYSILHILLLSRKIPPFWPGSVVVNDYATRKKITRSRCGIWADIPRSAYGTRTMKYYCKNMKYRINITRKMVPITGRASSFLENILFVCTLIERKRRRGSTEQKLQSYQFTHCYTTLHRLQVHHLTH